jgi:hypothetical protein
MELGTGCAVEEFFEGEEFPSLMLRYLLGIYLLQAEHVGIQALYSGPEYGQTVMHGYARFAAALETLQIERGYTHPLAPRGREAVASPKAQPHAV